MIFNSGNHAVSFEWPRKTVVKGYVAVQQNDRMTGLLIVPAYKVWESFFLLVHVIA